ncbi:hypothetical protein CRG98_033591 [Punica granatum]|uniref:Uncharacterized protein n=1 Tax=Punica granatum TaxID=22663 RepID=A0A2I0IPN8_PUNGR|nr:hypothetical protein CRG98_033591 [Punica granatum]
MHAATTKTSRSRLLVDTSRSHHRVGHHSGRESLQNHRRGGGDDHHMHLTEDRKERGTISMKIEGGDIEEATKKGRGRRVREKGKHHHRKRERSQATMLDESD